MSAHEPPSAPTSPLAKRYKADPMDETMQDSTQAQSTIQLPAISSMLHPLDADIHGDRQFGGSGQFANMTPTPAALAMAGMGDSIPLQVKRLSPKAKLPTRGSEFAAGYDIYSAEDTVVPARGQVMLSTGIAIAVPPGTYGRVAPRSGLAVKHGIATGAGVIDYDYRGEVKLLLFNHSAADFQVREGDRMAQLVLEKITTPEVREVEVLPETSRGAGGFGSTGGFGPAI